MRWVGEVGDLCCCGFGRDCGRGLEGATRYDRHGVGLGETRQQDGEGETEHTKNGGGKRTRNKSRTEQN